MKKLVFIFLCTILAANIYITANAQVSTTERNALVALYNSTNGTNWTDNTNWLGASGTECTWYGVTCVSGNVTELLLNDNNLIGTLPVELVNLTNLTSLYVSSNQLTGPVPVELGNLTNLSNLSLWNNELTGAIPTELASLTKLNSLDLGGNQFTGVIPTELCNLTNLKNLDLKDNELIGAIPTEIGDLTNLTQLWLGPNQLTGTIPSELGNLTKLNYLWLWFNQLSGEIPDELANLSNLTFLVLDFNQLTGTIPTWLGGLTDLNLLALDSNDLIGTIPTELGNLTNLIILALNSNQLTGTIPVELGNLTDLTNLRLDHNQLIGVIPSEFGNLSVLETLLFNDNYLGGEIPTELMQLTSLNDNESDFCTNYLYTTNDTLRDFLNTKQIGGDWESCQISQNNIPEIERQALIAVYNSTNGANWNNNTGWLGDVGTECTWYGVTCDESNTMVQQLNLNSNQLNGTIPSELADLSNLQVLNLQVNSLSGAIPLKLGTLTNLQIMQIFANSLTGAIPSELGDLSNLTSLAISYNQLSGTIPVELGDLNNLIALSLSSNQLSGDIPVAIYDLTNLDRLYLDSNQLIGYIPSNIGNLTNLQLLWMNNNNLTDTIPTEMGNLINLSTLKLNNNLLTGEIPSTMLNLTQLGNPSQELIDRLSQWGLNTNTDFCGNELYTTDSALRNFLNEKQVGGDWVRCQVSSDDIDGDGMPDNWELTWFGDLSHNGTVDSDGDGYTDFQEYYNFTNPIVQDTPNPIPTSERDALIALYNNTNGGNWTNNTGWLSDPGSECSWYGIECDNSNQTVLGIKLESNNLSGMIPTELANLSNLQTLSFSGNYSNWSVPETGNNYLTGTIPSELGTLTNLTRLDLSVNQLTGTIPSELANLTNLQILSLGSNQLTGTIPTWIGGLNNLNNLGLGRNLFSGSIPTELGNLTNLSLLYLSYNQLMGTIPVELGNLSNLYGLAISYNPISGPIPADIGNLINLRYLWFHSDQLTGPIPTELGNLTQLQMVYLSENQLTGSIPTELGNCTNLTLLYLYGNQLTGSIPSELSNLNMLQNLHLGSNQLTGTIPVWLGSFTNLMQLYLSVNQFTGAIPQELNTLTNLTHLYLADNQLAGTIPAWLGNFPNLMQLGLRNNLFNGTIPDELGNLSNLNFLNLSGNQISGNIPTAFGDLGALQTMLINDNILSGEMPTELIQLTNLTDNESDFCGNQISTTDNGLRDFLNTKQIGGDWESCQDMDGDGVHDNVDDCPNTPPDTIVTPDGCPDTTQGRIEGIVSDDSNDQPIQGLTVNVYDYDSNVEMGTGQTAVDGAYSISGLPAGSYKVRVSGQGYAMEYYDNIYPSAFADPVDVTVSQITSGIDFSLASGGAVAGTIRDASTGQPITGLWLIYALNASGDLGTAVFTTSSSYTITGLAPGSYLFIASRYSGLNYTYEYYDNSYSSNAAIVVQVPAGQTVTDIDFDLAIGDSITGTITRDSDGQPIEGLRVVAYEPTTGFSINANSRYSGPTNSVGEYTITGLPPGNYRVSVNTIGTEYAHEHYHDVHDAENATLVPVNAGQTTPGIDFILSANGGGVEGTVIKDSDGLPIEGLPVTAFEYESGYSVGNSRTQSDGYYSITGLFPGNYRVSAGGLTNLNNMPGKYYGREHYNNAHLIENANPVTVTASNLTTDINFSLDADSDGDGVGDTLDVCPNTPLGTPVSSDGCRDTDRDGVKDTDDLCPDTPVGEDVDADGCSFDQLITPGDVNGDGTVDLADAIMALQILIGIEPAEPYYKEADVNGDEKIGLAEVIFILQAVVNSQ